MTKNYYVELKSLFDKGLLKFEPTSDPKEKNMSNTNYYDAVVKRASQMQGKVIFISAPYRASSEYQVRINIRAAEEAALHVWNIGGVAICPHKNTAGFGGAFGIVDETWLAGDLVLLHMCDAVYQVGSWENSQGCLIERQFAIDHDIPLFTNFYHLSKWMHQKKEIPTIP